MKRNVHGKTSQHDAQLLAAIAAKLLDANLHGEKTGDLEQALVEALKPFGYTSCEVCEGMTEHPYKFDESKICHHCKAAHFDMDRDADEATEDYRLDFSDAETTEQAWKFLIDNDLEWLGYEVDEHQRIYFSDLAEMDIAARYLEDINDMSGLRSQVSAAFDRDQAAKHTPDLEQEFINELTSIAKEKAASKPTRYNLSE